MFFDDHRKHGLRHNPFKALVAPRPIAWVSSVSADGVANLAPFSYFNACADRPPTVMFAPNNPRPNGEGKDTLRHVEQTNEFVVNLAGYDLREAMNPTSAHVDPSIDEFELAGLTPAPSVHVKAPRVAEARGGERSSLESPLHSPGSGSTSDGKSRGREQHGDRPGRRLQSKVPWIPACSPCPMTAEKRLWAGKPAWPPRST